jgi:hypothetical protein
MDTNQLTNRLMRVFRFEPTVYREVAADPPAMSQSLTVVILAAILAGLGNFGQAAQMGIVETVILVILGIIGTLISFALFAAVAAFVAQTLFQGKTSFQEMARTLGFAYSWNALGVLNIIPFIGWIFGLVGWLAALVSTVIALRESSEFDTTKALVTAIIAAVVGWFTTFCVTTLIGLPILVALGLAAGAGQ